MLWGMRQASFLTPLTRPIGWSGAAAVIAGAAMGAPVGARVTCYLTSWLPGTGGCAPGGFPAGALVDALLALVALPLLGQGTRRGEHAAHRPAPTTTTAARLVWLAIAAALGRWLAEAVVNQELGQEGTGGAGGSGVAGDPAPCAVAAAGLAMEAQGLLRRRGWARWAAVVAFALLGITALAGLVDWVRVLVVSRARRWEEVTAEMLAVDLVTVVLFLAASVGVIVLLMTPATRRDFQSTRQPPAATNGR
jgi:hypothetical protein